ncbi:MAG: TolC family protein [Campylobacterota bacterium]
MKKQLVISAFASMILVGCTVKPTPIPENEIKEQIKQDMETIQSAIPAIEKPLSLSDAIELGIQHNRQKKLKIMETALAQQNLDVMHYDMLGDLTANAGYTVRDKYAASASTTFEDGSPSALGSNPTYSVSQDKKSKTADITFSWNILDFGLSYVRAQQQADKFLIAKEKEKKIRHNITQEITNAYYQAITAEHLLSQIQPLMAEVKGALNDTEQIKALRIQNPMQALTYQRELLNIMQDLTKLEKSFISSKLQLAELMGLTPNTKFELAQSIQKRYDDISIPYTDVMQMEQTALENRPELAESRYQERISQKDITAAKLSMLPGITLNAGLNYNDSKYLLNNEWNTYGASVSWNLLNVFKGAAETDMAKSKNEIAKEQKLALSMAVISQVHLSLVNFAQAKREYELSAQALDVSEQILEQQNIMNKVQTTSKLFVIKEKLSYLLATLKHQMAYAGLQNSHAMIYVSMGLEPQLTNNSTATTTEEKIDVVKVEEPIKEADISQIQQVTTVQTTDVAIIANDVSTEQTPVQEVSQNDDVSVTPVISGKSYAIIKQDVKSREKPSMNSTSSILRGGEVVEIIGKTDNWYETDKGFVYSNFILPINEAGEKIVLNTTGTTAKNANIRETADVHSTLVKTINKGDTIDIIEAVYIDNTTWYKTEDGYVISTLIELN